MSIEYIAYVYYNQVHLKRRYLFMRILMCFKKCKYRLKTKKVKFLSYRVHNALTKCFNFLSKILENGRKSKKNILWFKL